MEKNIKDFDGWIALKPGCELPQKRIRVHAWDGLIIWEAYIDNDNEWKWMYADARGEAHQSTKGITHWRELPDPPNSGLAIEKQPTTQNQGV